MGHVFISGISAGIGLALAEEAWRRGWSVSGCARRRERLDVLAAAHGERWCTHAADVKDGNQIAAAVQEAVTAHGPIDLLVANAGRGQDGALLDLGEDALRELFELNLLGVHRLVREARRYLAAGAVIQVVSSVVAFVPVPLMGAYCASKHALEAWAAALRMELRDEDITVLTVCPGTVDTEFFDRAAERGGEAWTWRPGTALAATVVARRMLRQARRRRPRRLLTPLSARIMAAGYRCLPGLAEAVMIRVLRRLRCQGLRGRGGGAA